MRRAALLILVALSLSSCGATDETVTNTTGSADELKVEAEAISKVRGRPVGIALEDGSLWVAAWEEGAVSRLDPESGERLAEIQTGDGALEIEAGEGSVWVSNHLAGTVSQIDPATNKVINEVEVGEQPEGLAVADGVVWVTVEGENAVARIDAASAALIGKTEVGHEPRRVAVDDGYAWVTGYGDSTLTKIDAATGEVAATAKVGFGPDGVAAGDGLVWIAAGVEGEVQVFDADTLERTGRHPVSTPVDVDIADGLGWVTDQTEDAVGRIDFSSDGSESDWVPVGKGPRELVVVGDTIYVTCETSNEVWRIRLV